jgi:hypothetical protein
MIAVESARAHVHCLALLIMANAVITKNLDNISFIVVKYSKKMSHHVTWVQEQKSRRV